MKHPKLKKKKDRSRAPFCAQRKAAESPRWSSTRDIRQSAAARGWVPCRLLPPSPFPLPGSRHQTCVEASAWNRINTDSSLTPDPVFGCTRTVAPPSGTARREIELPGLEACLLRVGHRHTASNTLHQLVVQVVQRNLKCGIAGLETVAHALKGCRGGPGEGWMGMEVGEEEDSSADSNHAPKRRTPRGRGKLLQ